MTETRTPTGKRLMADDIIFPMPGDLVAIEQLGRSGLHL